MDQGRVEREVRLGYNHSKRSYVSVTREHYLREDIPCRSELCVLCGDIPSQRCQARGLLSGQVSHYAVPDVQCLGDYLELWQHPAITDLILLQTTLTHLRRKAGRQSYSSVRQLLTSSVKRCVLFSNDHHWQTFSLRQPSETLHQWQRRLVYKAGVWYANHLQVSGKAPTIVIISETPEAYSELAAGGGDTAEGLLVMSVADYLACFWPSVSDLSDLYHSLRENTSTSDTPTSGVKDFMKHFPPRTILDGLKMGEFVQGRLQVSSHHPRDEATVTVMSGVRGGRGEEGGEMKVTILGGAARNRAIHNDRVAVRLIPHSEGQKDGVTLGMVVGILERDKREYVATFEEKEDDSRDKTEKVLVMPYDVRIPRIRIGTRQARLLRSHRIVVRIDSWVSHSRYPDGHFVRTIGPIGDIETETAVIMIEHDLQRPSFSRALLNELPEGDGWRVDEREVRKRRDLRDSHLVFSIDPQGCEDVDDTLSVRHLKRGVTELGVHIADVSHFVRPGTLTDKEARHRSTSVYLADRRYDMLPAVLNAQLCSLLSNVDRYAVSVVWNLDADYQVKKVWFGRTVIRSRYKLSYEVAQRLCDGAAASHIRRDIPELMNSDLKLEELQKRVETLREAVRSLGDIAQVLKHRRAQDGAVELDSVEVKVQINEENQDTTQIENLIPKQHLEVHDTIAECMIFANHWVAKKIHASLPTSSLLRRHPPPSQDRFRHLRTCAGVRGFQISTQTNGELAESLNKAMDPCDPEINKIVRNLATQAMCQAEYFSTGNVSPYRSNTSSFHSSVSPDHSSMSPDHFSHYGLALDYYTHFTSPIRRYADLIVHRQLLAVVEGEEEEEEEGEGEEEGLPSNIQLAEYCKHMNTKHRSAQLAQIASTELFQALYFSSHEKEEERCVVVGVVYDIISKGVRVQVPRYGVKGLVYLKDKTGLVPQPSHHNTDSEPVIFSTGHLQVEETRVTVVHTGGQYTLGLLDRVRVKISAEFSRAHGPSLRLQLMSCTVLEPLQSSIRSHHTDRKQVVASVKDDIVQKATSPSHPSPSSPFSQTHPHASLYCFVQHLHSLSLLEDD